MRYPFLFLTLLFWSSAALSQTLTISSNGQTGTSGTNWSTSGSNPIIITTGAGTANVNTSVIEGYLNAGTSVMLEGSLIMVSNAIDKTAGGDATLTFRAGGTNTEGYGRVSIGADIQSTLGALNIVLWSDYNNHNRAGATAALSATITTNGGHFWMGGSATAQGSTTWNGLTVGDGPSVNAAGATNQNAIDFDGVTLSTSGGDVFMWAAPGAGAGTQGINFHTSSSVNTGTGDIILAADVLAGAPTLTSTGHLYLVPDGGAYGGAVTWSHNNASPDIDVSGTFDALNINAFNSLGGFTIGEYTGMTGVTFSNTSNVTVTNSINVSGPISVYGGNIAINENLNTSAGSAAGDVLLKASGNVNLANTKSITTAGGDVTFWADSDNNRVGGIRIGSDFAGVFTTAITTNGGDIILSGGSDPLTGYAHYDGGLGAAQSTYRYAIGVFGATLNAGGSSDGGNILIRGSGGNTFNGKLWTVNIGGQYGANTKLETNGTGTISIVGDGSEAPSVTSWATVIPGTVETESGNIALIGLANVAQVNARGFSISGSIQSASGTISLEDRTPNTANANYTGPFINGAQFGKGSLSASSSNVSLVADKFAFDNNVAINTTGTVAISSYGDSFLGALSFPISNLNVSSTAGGLTIGKPTNTANITFGSATSIAGPISVYGGDITVNQNLTSTASAADILLKASGYIAMASGSSNSAYRTLQTNNGNIVLWANSADGTSGGIQLGDWVTLNSANGSIAQSTGGGKVWLAGGSGVNAQGLPTGAANGGTARSGISFGSYSPAATTTSIYSGGGDIYLNGESNAINPGLGVVWNRTGIANAGNGTVTIKGEAKNASGQHGIELGASSGSINIISGGGDASTPAILINGITARSDIFRGLQTISGPGTRSIMQATGTGGITILAKGVSSGTAASYASTLDVLAASGDILISAEGGTGLDQVGTIGQKTGTDVTSSFSNVTLRANAITVFAGTEVQTTGTLVVEPFGTSFTNALTWPLSNLTLGSGITGLTLGKEGNTANLTINSAQTIAGPISIYGGTITLNANLTTTNSGDISLYTDNALGGLTTSRTLTADGAFKYIPRGSSFASAVSFPITNLNATHNGLVIGNATNDKDITITAPITGTGPVGLFGGVLSLNDNITCSTLDLKGTATLAAAKYINASGNFTHEGSVRLAANSSNYSQMKVSGTITTNSGTINHEQNLSTGWRMIGASMNASQASYFGNVGSTGSGHTSNTQNLFSWDGSNYVNLADANASISPGTGYFGYVGNFGFRAAGVQSFAGIPNLSITPSLNNATASNSVTIEGSHIDERQGWNLVANPFTCALDFATLSRNDVDNAFYIYNNNKSGGAGYESWSAGGITDPYIAPMQSFWVKANGSSPSLGTMAMATHGTVAQSPALLKTSPKNFDRLVLRSQELADSLNSDYTVVAFIQGTQDAYDSEWDAYKMANGSDQPNIYSLHQGTGMATNAIDYGPGYDGIKSLDIAFRAPKHGEPYQISYDQNYMLRDYAVYLEDRKNQSYHNLAHSPYRFAHDSGMVQRFVLHLQSNSVGVNEFDNAQNGLQAWAHSGQLFFLSNYEGPVSVELRKLNGQLVYGTALELPAASLLSHKLPSEMAKGIYLLSVTDKAAVRHFKIYLP